MQLLKLAERDFEEIRKILIPGWYRQSTDSSNTGIVTVALSYSLRSSANENLIGAHGVRLGGRVYLEIARAKLRLLRVSAALANKNL